ncbi:MAG: AAA family ATPase [Candidatus Sedimenticola sp. (ex Thyasira tokunagai)]
MIITDISARNFLKYGELDLKDLPESSVITIAGPNESGKSSIGETVCFGLFGRTFSLGVDELNKLIRWGETHCSVNLRFRTESDEIFEIARFLDRDGNHGARLSRAGEEEPFARGNDKVEDALYELLGYGYDEFIESYYLAQREITTPHPHSHAVKTMAGVSSLEYVAYEYEQEIEQERKAVDAADVEVDELDQTLAELDLDEGALAALEAERNDLVSESATLQRELDGLDAASIAYQESAPKVRRARSARGRARFLRFVALLLALVPAISWGLIERLPGHDYTLMLQDYLIRFIPQWGDQYVPWLIYGAGGFALLFMLLWFRVAGRGAAITKLQTFSNKLTECLKSVDGRASEFAGYLPGDEASADELQQRPETAEVADFGRRVNDSLATPTEVRDFTGREQAWMRLVLQKLQEKTVHKDQAIRSESERRRKSETLVNAREGVLLRIADHERRVQLRELAMELLEGSCRHLSQRFNRDLRDLVGKTLPMFTDNRYEHLQIDEELTVRVFSSDKRDFLDLEEISSGTQRQIMLALRLALVQKLVNSTQGGRQFLFLDEPFAFFDEERTRNALKALPELSNEISQIWIVAQTFPKDQTFDLTVSCERDQTTLVL